MKKPEVFEVSAVKLLLSIFTPEHWNLFVLQVMLCFASCEFFLFVIERRSVPELSSGVCTGDSKQGGEALQQEQDDHSHIQRETLHVPAHAQSPLHTHARHLSPRHQAPEPPAQHRVRNPQTLRLRQVRPCSLAENKV